MVLLILLVLVVIIALILVYYYNKLVSLRNFSESSWSDIDVQLKRRWDLVPNLVEIVKGYASHEKETFEKVVEARSRAMNAGSVEEHAKAENMLSGTLKSLFALSEAYPDLKANLNFVELQNSINAIENDIQLARRYYNAVVRDLNTMCESFPSVLAAKMFGFSKKQYFEMDVSEKENVKISFQ